MLRAHICHRFSHTLIRSPSSRLSSRAADDRDASCAAGMAESEAKARSPAAAMMMMMVVVVVWWAEGSAWR
jgi:hypothetical protein